MSMQAGTKRSIFLACHAWSQAFVPSVRAGWMREPQSLGYTHQEFSLHHFEQRKETLVRCWQPASFSEISYISTGNWEERETHSLGLAHLDQSFRHCSEMGREERMSRVLLKCHRLSLFLLRLSRFSWSFFICCMPLGKCQRLWQLVCKIIFTDYVGQWVNRVPHSRSESQA